MSIHWMGYLVAFFAVIVAVIVWHKIQGVSGATA